MTIDEPVPSASRSRSDGEDGNVRAIGGENRRPGPSRWQMPDLSGLERPLLVVSVDTEEDFDWSAPFSAEARSIASIRCQELGQRVMERYGIIPAYLCDFPIADQEAGWSILRDWHEAGRCVIGAQLHPWVNPPHTEQINEVNSYPCNLPLELAHEKLRRLTERIEETIGVRPTVYKAGRNGAAGELEALLRALGYRVDMSFHPTRDYRGQGGPDHTRYPQRPFWLDEPGGILSIPTTSDMVGPLRRHWRSLHGALWGELGTRMHLPGALNRLGLLNRVTLTPEGVSLQEAKVLTRVMLAAGHRVFSLSYHSPSLMPGCTPYVRNLEDRERFLAWLEGYLEFFRGELGGTGATPEQLRDLSCAAPVEEHARGPRPEGGVVPRSRPGRGVAVFDFLSHDSMHHAFNEGYLRTLRAAFPDDPITFHARQGHLSRLAPRIADLPGIELRPCAPFQVPYGMSRHNPLGGHLAARACLRSIREAIGGADPRLVAVLGVDTNLFDVIGHGWEDEAQVPLHLILHGHLGEAMVWRSRNPFVRANDFISRLRRPLPPRVRLIALELGVAEGIAAIGPRMAASVETLEHPVLPQEWGPAAAPPNDGRIRLAFLGHARLAKGFGIFADLARRCAGRELEFHAIGLAAPESRGVDMSGLAQRPDPEGRSRTDYLEALRAMDLVCLPLNSRAYAFTASGTVSDAIAALKPLVALRNPSLDAITARYGPIGYLVESAEEMASLLARFDVSDFMARRDEWIANLSAIREQRRPDRLGEVYAEAVRRLAVPA